MVNLKEEIRELAYRMGIVKVGFTSKERLDDAPLSGNLSHVLPGARSAISLVVAFDKAAIRAYLAKTDQISHIKDHAASYIKLGEVAREIHSMLKANGYESSAPFPNEQYRKDQPFMSMIPPLSHRYVAVASGIGWLGWSGNVVTPEYGAAIALTSVATSANLEPDPIIEGDSCKNCHLCAGVCAGHFIAMKEAICVNIADHTYTHNKKANNLRCLVTCGGANGIRDLNSKWSTWSYKVLDLPGPGNDEAFIQKVLKYSHDPKNRLLKGCVELPEKLDLPDWEHFNHYFEETFINKRLFTCGNCMLICWPEMQDRKENYHLLMKSGRVIKGEHGPIVVMEG